MKDLIIDYFAGGGGASVGIEMALGRPVDIAVNHNPQAIRMHKTNHPDTLHLTEDIFTVDLKKHVKSRRVALMWASPDCTSHSKAKGGKPQEKDLRILPWAVYKHARTIKPDVILMENVFLGRPYPKKEQVARIGNSVVPIVVQKLVEANCPYLKVGERMPNMRIDVGVDGQLRFA